jgi:hypothetical protein
MKVFPIEIKPLKGMPPLVFGASTEKVAKQIGDPTQTELLDEDDEFFTPTLIWHYPDHGISLFFEGDEHQLTSVESDNQETLLFGQKIFSLSKKQIEELMTANNYHDEEEEMEAWGEERMSYNDALIDFYFDGEQLSTVDWGIIPE